MSGSAKQVGWPFPTEDLVLPCHCETFIRADLGAFRDVVSSPFDRSLSLHPLVHLHAFQALHSVNESASQLLTLFLAHGIVIP
jgi:hypothetical protein